MFLEVDRLLLGRKGPWSPFVRHFFSVHHTGSSRSGRFPRVQRVYPANVHSSRKLSAHPDAIYGL